MKITKQQLKRLIKEELSILIEGRGERAWERGAMRHAHEEHEEHGRRRGFGRKEQVRRSDDDIYEDLKNLVMGLNMMSQQDKNRIIGQTDAAIRGGRDKVKINMWIAQTLAQAFPQASSVQRELDVIMRG